MGLDAVELVMAVEEAFGIAIPDAEAAKMITPALMISYVQNSVSSRPESNACISLRAFHRVRAGLMKSTGVGRSEVTLKTPINKLFSGPQRTQHWKDFQAYLSLTSLPNLGFGTGWLFSPTSVNDLVSIAISQSSDELREQRSWTHHEVREIVRRIISDQLGIRDFNDADEFVRDLGVD